jgi:hypothetical protein
MFITLWWLVILQIKNRAIYILKNKSQLLQWFSWFAQWACGFWTMDIGQVDSRTPIQCAL